MGSFRHNLPHVHLPFFQCLQTLVMTQLLFTWIYRSAAHSVLKLEIRVNAYTLLHIPN